MEEQNNIIKSIIKKGFKKSTAIILIVLVVFLVLSLSKFSTDDTDTFSSGDEDSKYYREYGSEAYKSKVYINENGTLMSEMSVNEMWKEDERYSRYLSSKDTLAYLMNAQVVTQIPYIESAKDNEINGVIRFFRNNSLEPMVYCSNEQLQKYVDEYNTNRNEEAKQKALNSFSLNNNGSITIANFSSSTHITNTNNESDAANDAEIVDENYSSNSNGRYIVYKYDGYLGTTSINYSSFVDKYTLPFNLLWDIVVYGAGSQNAGDSETLACTIASMAYDSKIDLIIDDNKTVTTTTTTLKYKQKFYAKGKTWISYVGTNAETGESWKSNTFESMCNQEEGLDTYLSNNNFVTITTEINEVNIPDMKNKEISTWISKYKNNSLYSINTDTSQTENNVPLDDTEKVTDKSNYPFNASTVSELEQRFSRIKNMIQVSRNKSFLDDNNLSYEAVYGGSLDIYTNFVNRTESCVVKTERTGYLTPDTTSPEFNEEIVDIFKMKLFRTDVTAWLMHDWYKQFMKAIAKNEDTANLSDYINYIFNKIDERNSYTSKDYMTIWNEFSGVNYKSVNESSFNENGIEKISVPGGDGYSTMVVFDGRTYKEFKQDKYSSYSQIRYSAGDIASSGCGPTSTAIIASGYGIDFNPGSLVKATLSRLHKTNLTASADSTEEMIKTTGLSYTRVYRISKERLKAHLEKGKPVVISVTKPFGGASGHYIALLHINGDQVYVSNPLKNYTSGYYSIDQIITSHHRGTCAFLINN